VLGQLIFEGRVIYDSGKPNSGLSKAIILPSASLVCSKLALSVLSAVVSACRVNRGAL
jgi:hypothetical protein